MIKKLLYLFGILCLVLFVYQNSAHVAVEFLVGKFYLRSVFLMLICFVGGFLTGYYFVFRKEEILLRKIRQLRNELEEIRSQFHDEE